MRRVTRRQTIEVGTGALLGAALLGSYPQSLLAQEIPAADVDPPNLAPEPGAKLRVLRPMAPFASDEDFWRTNTESYTAATGIEVTLDFLPWSSVASATEAAVLGDTPADLVLTWAAEARRYPEDVQDLSEVADYLGQRYGGWWPLAETFGRGEGETWSALPIGARGSAMVYRKFYTKFVGYPDGAASTDAFLDLGTKLVRSGHPIGWTLGHAIGDANQWARWLLWSFDALETDGQSHVVLKAKETVEACRFVRELAPAIFKEVVDWGDADNRASYLRGQTMLTLDGPSIYKGTLTSERAGMHVLVADTHHARLPVGPVGEATEPCIGLSAIVPTRSAHPKAALDYLRFMMEWPQYHPWYVACLGYWSHPLKVYDLSPVFDDPKLEVFRHVMRDARHDGHPGPLNAQAAALSSDFALVDMVAASITGSLSPENAAAEAAGRVRRLYES